MLHIYGKKKSFTKQLQKQYTYQFFLIYFHVYLNNLNIEKNLEIFSLRLKHSYKKN